MPAFSLTTGQLLRSVALRYRQPLGGAPRDFAGRGTHCRVFGVQAARHEIEAEEGPDTRPPHLRSLEAILFLARLPLGSRKLAHLAGLADGTKARTLVRALNRRYDAEGSAFRVEEVAGGFQLLTRARFAPWLRRAHETSLEIRLSAPALETLAVVAYRQPVLRTEVEAIRGVGCDEILRQLIERDLLRIVGRSEELGRPLLYGTTRRFMQVFGLRHLDELPRYDVLRSAMLVGGSHAGVMTDADKADKHTNSLNHCHEEENNVKTLATKKTVDEELAGMTARALMEPELHAQPADGDDHDDEDVEEEDLDEEEEDEDEEEEDEDEEDDDWEEVEDEDEDLDDEDWDEDDDWEDDDWDDEEEEEEEADKE